MVVKVLIIALISAYAFMKVGGILKMDIPNKIPLFILAILTVFVIQTSLILWIGMKSIKKLRKELEAAGWNPYKRFRQD